MRIGVNTLFYIPGEVGGTETYLRNILGSMARMFPHVELVIFTNIENHPVLQADLSSYPQVEFRLLHFHAKNRYVRIIREQIELPLWVCKTGIDVLWSPGYTTPVFSACPRVTTIPDMQYRRHPEDLSLLARVTTHLLVTAAAKRSDCIVTLSDFSKKEITRLTRIPPHKIRPILLAIVPEFGKQPVNQIDPVDDSLAPVAKGPYILSVANSYPHKNLHTLIDAFGQIVDRIDHSLVLIGLPRRGEKQLQEAIGRIADKERIVRIGRVSTEELISWYRNADLFVFPSLYEGFGLPVLEAMMAGTPVVTTKMGSIPEVGGNKVVYADPPDAGTVADRIFEILNWDEKKRECWVQNAKTRADAFSWHITAKNTMNVLKKAATTGAPMRSRTSIKPNKPNEKNT